MSDQPPSNEPSLPAESTPEPPPKPKSNWDFQKVLLVLAIGILIGSLFTRPVIDYLLSHLSALVAVFVALLLFILIAVLALPRIINYLAKRYTGQDVDVEAAVGDIQAKANHIADTVAGFALAKADPQVRQNIRQDLPGLLHYLVFSRLRNSGLRMLMTVFVAIGGLMGTILLYNQNQLLQKQNEKIDNQILLDEAARRSSLNFLLGNVLDQVNQELSDPENTKRRLSPQLIGRIASLSQSFQPYYFMEDGEMIDRPLSPERGALLLALVNSGLDTLTLNEIFDKTVFTAANLAGATLGAVYLKGVNLEESNLLHVDLKGANLIGADLSGANLRTIRLNNANLSEANLKDSDLRGAILLETDLKEAIFLQANLKWANLIRANLTRSDLRFTDLKFARLVEANLTDASMVQADLFRANLMQADLNNTDLSGASLKGAYLEGANLIAANLSETIGLSHRSLKSCCSIYQIKGLPENLATLLKAEIEMKPE